MSRDKRRVLFLCAGNSCRSQMAEAIVNARFSSRWLASSAGTRPAGFVHPLAVRTLAEAGILHHGKSKGLDSVRGIRFDLIVTLCDEAREECPIWFGPGQLLHHGYEDPASVAGMEEERMGSFREVRDRMLREIPYLLEKHDCGKMES